MLIESNNPQNWLLEKALSSQQFISFAPEKKSDKNNAITPVQPAGNYELIAFNRHGNRRHQSPTKLFF